MSQAKLLRPALGVGGRLLAQLERLLQIGGGFDGGEGGLGPIRRHHRVTIPFGRLAGASVMVGQIIHQRIAGACATLF